MKNKEASKPQIERQNMTKETEFNLSEKIHRERVKWKTEVIDKKDVKEFIRLLKERVRHLDIYEGLWSEAEREALFIEIDKLAGDKLK